MLNDRQAGETQTWVVERQLGIVRNALLHVSREGGTLTEDHIKRAAARVGWVSRSEYARRQAEPKRLDFDVERRERFDRLIGALRTLSGFNPETIVEEFAQYGGPRDWPGFDEALDFVAKLAELSKE
jgi:hypothetical protein